MEIVIGAACGLVMGTLFTSAWGIMLSNSSRGTFKSLAFLSRPSMPANLRLLVPVIGFAAWGLVGAILGLFLFAANQLFPADGLGSPNLAFTILVLLLTINGLVLALLWEGRRDWWEAYGLGAVFAGLFGWLMPWLAE